MIPACDVLCFLRLCNLFCLMGVKYGVWSMQIAGSACPLFIIDSANALYMSANQHILKLSCVSLVKCLCISVGVNYF